MFLLLFLLFLALSSGDAAAGPLIPAFVAAIGLTGLAASVASFAIGLAISFGVSYLLNKFLGPKADAAGGTQLEIRVDAEVPQSLIVGRATTAGSLVTAETYGSRGDIDNSDLIEIIAIADHPCEGLVKVFIDAQEEGLGVDDGNRGQEVDGYESKLAIKFFDGSQTTADAFAVSALGLRVDRPWTSNHIGVGITYVRTHSIYNRELVSGQMQWRFVVDGIRLYDPRLDTTVGGAGAHRWGDLATHEFTANLAVIAYNILRGIRVADSTDTPRHFYGLENTPAANLPLDNWFAAMNEADVVVDAELQFHGGGEITVDTEPMEALRSILASCGGRLVEIGGVYKIYLGAPGLPVLEITDETLLAKKGDTFRPSLGLEQRVNYLTGTYTSPTDGWIPKVAPPRSNALWETADGRRLPSDLQVPMVQSGLHMQRLMQQLLNRSRQQRSHVIPLPRIAFVVEPGDVIEWSSTRNGYNAKLFEVQSAEYESNLETTLSVIEIDPGDYDWEADYDYTAEADGIITQTRPEPKIVGGFTASAYLHLADNGAKKPAIKLIWDPPDDDDIDGILYQLRRPSLPSDVINGSSDEPESGLLIILAGLASLTEYEIRARWRSFNGYATDWSLWIPVTTPDAAITAADLDAALLTLIESVEASLPPDIFTIKDDLDSISSSINTQITVLREMIGRVNIGAGARYNENKAGIELVTTAVTGINSALAGLFVDLFAISAAGVAEGKMRFVASSAPAGVLARFAIELRAATTEDWAFAGMYLDAGVAALGGASRVTFVADRFQIISDADDTYFQDGVWTSTDGLMEINFREGRMIIYDNA